MPDPEPTPAPASIESRELYTVYVNHPTDGTRMPTPRPHETLAGALVEAAAQLAAYPGWSVEIAHRLHTITELSRIRLPTEEWPWARICEDIAEYARTVEGKHAALPAPRRRIAPLF
jgi:hypothetical protein